MPSLLLFPIHNSGFFFPFSLIVVFIITLILTGLFIDLFYNDTVCPKSRSNTWVILVFDVVRRPLLILLCCYAIYAASDLIQLYLPNTLNITERFRFCHALSLIEVGILSWILVRATLIFKRLTDEKS